jgi:hypothetical protein
MTEAVEKNKLISVSYEESPASYHNEELAMSIAPEDALAVGEVSQEALAPTPDQYQGRLTGLSLETLVETDVAVRQEGVPPSIQLRSLIVEAGRGAPWAVDELENFLTRTLGLKDASQLNLCLDSCEANVADILVQLRQGDELQRQEAARSLLGIILGQPRDAGVNVDDLKRGLLVAAGQIAKVTKSETFYREVAQLDEQQQQNLWTMSHDSRVKPDPKLLLTLKENLTKSPEAKQEERENISESTETKAILAGSSASPVGETGVAAITSAALNSPTTKALAWPNGGLTLIEQILDETLPQTSEQQRFLQGSGGQTLSQRLSEITQNPSLTTAQISQGLYYAILGKALGHFDFTSAQQHYGELRPVAAQIAGAIIARLGLASEAKTYLKGDYSALRADEKKPGRELNAAIEATASGRTPLSLAASRSYSIPMTQSLGIFAKGEGNSLSSASGILATSSAVAAGMMAIPFLSLVGGTQRTQVGSRSDSRPSYFIEGTTTAQGESHGGTGGQSSQRQQQERQSQNPETVFLA